MPSLKTWQPMIRCKRWLLFIRTRVVVVNVVVAKDVVVVVNSLSFVCYCLMKVEISIKKEWLSSSGEKSRKCGYETSVV